MIFGVMEDEKAITLNILDNVCLKGYLNGNSKKRISTGKDGVIRVLPPVSAAEIHAIPTTTLIVGKLHGAEVSTEMQIPQVSQIFAPPAVVKVLAMDNGESQTRCCTNKVKSGSLLIAFAYSTYTSFLLLQTIFTLEREVPTCFSVKLFIYSFVQQSEDLDLLHDDHRTD
ncbi:hypothetical protein Tco_0369196 [Tanacetum coccineum]